MKQLFPSRATGDSLYLEYQTENLPKKDPSIFSRKERTYAEENLYLIKGYQ
ncbi:MAG: hypothetical protein WCR02_07710 [Sphaerochaetaceae bacterium]